MNEILILFVFLLPFAWFMGYRNGKSVNQQRKASGSGNLSKEYFTGLNYILNEQSDKAIDTFIAMLEVDSETVETHLAVGNLYRKRGEVDIAIRIHQNLIARPSLSSVYRKISLRELGYDYMAAGLLDRAENIFKELLLDQNHKQTSLKQLLLIYQQTKDWENAIKVSEKIKLSEAPEIKKEIAHFYCEMAESQACGHSKKEAQVYVKHALSADPLCVRAILLHAKLHYLAGKYKQAIKTYRELLRQDIKFLAEALETIKACFIQLNDKKGFNRFLLTAIENGAGVSTILCYAEELRVQEGDRVCAEFLARKMAEHPSVKGLMKLIELHLKHAGESAKPSLQMLHDIVEKLLKNKPVYHCEKCGFDAKTLFWQCPGCKSWGSVKPIQGIEGE